MSEITFTSEIKVELIQSCGGDEMVVAAAKVSTCGQEAVKFAKPEFAESNAGLINYLMQHRHGCYDEETEVLTTDGWIPWPKVTGNEKFCTLNAETNKISYQNATAINLGVDYSGRMYSVKGNGVDLLVTPNHKMFVCQMTTREGRLRDDFRLISAEHLNHSNCCYKKNGNWDFPTDLWKSLSPDLCEFLGFAIGDGHLQGKTVSFHLRRLRKIKYLKALCGKISCYLTEKEDRFYVHWPFDFSIYENKEKLIPHDFLLNSTKAQSEGLLKGLMASDGSVGITRTNYLTTSALLAGQIQQLGLNLGISINYRIDYVRLNSFGDKPLFCLSLTSRGNYPEVNRVRSTKNHTKWVDYSGKIYCVTVPNGILYVRRNGKPVWCGNSPFEHSFLTFFVHAPIFVFREWHRHRIGFSYNETSGRYSELEPIFWVPGPDRKIVPAPDHKSARPKFVAGSAQQLDDLMQGLIKSYRQSYEMYQSLLFKGYAKEVSRACLPVGIYSSCWVSCNPRSLMAFLSLRTHEPEAKFVSYPQAEIEIAARSCEQALAIGWPLTYAAFVKNGRCV